ncbi:MAG: hypothetical protein EBU90_26240 [Proteobacteria bacterium]|nr:hypothetical protein [Pseudomonadota bacterium]
MKKKQYLMHYCGGWSLEYAMADSIQKLKKKFGITETTPKGHYRVFKAVDGEIVEIGLNGQPR